MPEFYIEECEEEDGRIVLDICKYGSDMVITFSNKADAESCLAELNAPEH